MKPSSDARPMIDRLLSKAARRSVERTRTATQEAAPDPLLLRLERHLPDLIDGLGRVYGSAEQLASLLDRLLDMMLERHVERPADLRRLDAWRALEPDWLQVPEQVGYVCYVDRFAGNLRGMHKHLDHLQALGVTYLHLMPLLQARSGDSDGGYAVTDFRAVDSALGTIDDLQQLAAELRQRGISLCIDLVLNHVAREHAWAVAARRGDPRYRGYFWIFPDRSQPDAYERHLPEIFPAFSPGSFTYDDALGAWVWTTFHSFQWDLNWTNPDVFFEVADLILYLANIGVEVFRLDAIAFLWKRLGTDCQNQPEVHAIVQALRAVARIVAPAVAFKAEAIVGPNHLVHYLGIDRYHGKVSDLAYHNSLMVQIWSAFATRDTRLMTHALRRLAPKPPTCTWITYVRCHDDIGWAVDDADAAAVGWDGAAHRRFLADYYAGVFPGSHARGEPFQVNAQTGDRRSCGTTASLNGVELALERGDAALLTLSIERILLAHALLMSFDGIPMIYMGDEIGLLNDHSYRDDPHRAGDNRWMHRPFMPWQHVARRHQLGTVEQRIFDGLCVLIAARKRTPQLHAATAAQILDLGNPQVFGLARPHPLGRLVALFNFSERPQRIQLPTEVRPWDAIAQAPIVADGGELTLPAYGRLWLPDGTE